METLEAYRSKEVFMTEIPGVKLNEVCKMIKPKVEKKKKKKKPRCFICNSKVGLLGYRCECNSKIQFCPAHRLPESHNCTFDFKSKGKKILESKLVKVNNSKIDKI